MSRRNENIDRIVVDGVKVALGRNSIGSTKVASSDWMCTVEPTDDNAARTYSGIPIGTVLIYNTPNMDTAVKAYGMLVDGKKVSETIRLCEELYGEKLSDDAYGYSASGHDNIIPNDMILIDIAKVVLDVSSKYTGGKG